jgi:hypothetical protein
VVNINGGLNVDTYFRNLKCFNTQSTGGAFQWMADLLSPACSLSLPEHHLSFDPF